MLFCLGNSPELLAAFKALSTRGPVEDEKKHVRVVVTALQRAVVKDCPSVDSLEKAVGCLRGMYEPPWRLPDGPRVVRDL